MQPFRDGGKNQSKTIHFVVCILITLPLVLLACLVAPSFAIKEKCSACRAVGVSVVPTRHTLCETKKQTLPFRLSSVLWDRNSTAGWLLTVG